ncbi:MAG: aminodeoxychorismate synthase component I [Ignavibacteriales bacterium]
MLSKIESINKINYLSTKSTPFLFIIDFDMGKNIVLSQSELQGEEICFSIINFAEYNNFHLRKKQFQFSKHPLTFNEYSKAFSLIQEEISAGNSYLVNLTFPTEIKTDLSLLDIFQMSEAKFKLFFRNEFVVFSPEPFIEIHDNVISSFPMKGTIDAEIENAEQIILEDEKEKAEHTTIVDLIRNDLSIVAKNVFVEKFRYIEKINTNQKNILQVSSKISGELPKEYKKHLGNIIYKLLPAGSISGAPKRKTVEIIKNVEKVSRGFFTGIFGYFDGNNLQSAVMIRFIERKNDTLFFRSGGGITFMSDVNSEYQELIDKVYVPIY